MPPQQHNHHHQAPQPAFDVFATPASPPTAPAPTSMHVMGGAQSGRPVGLPGMAGGHAPQQAPAAYDQWKSPAASNADADFGDFEVAAPRPPAATKSSSGAASGDKWGAMSNLVNLSNISTNDAPKQSSSGSVNTDSRAQNSFAGLDGFSKNQQSMVRNF